MLTLIRTVCSFVTDHAVGIAAAVLAFLGAATIAYAREQVRAGIDWALAPLTRIFPWNNKTGPTGEHETLISDFSLVEVFLRDTKGKFARYQKTSNYVIASGELTPYREGVTAEGHADAFSTMRGTIAFTYLELTYPMRSKGARGSPISTRLTCTIVSQITKNTGPKKLPSPPNISHCKFISQKIDRRSP